MPVLLEGGEELVDLRSVLGPQAGLSLYRVNPSKAVLFTYEHYIAFRIAFSVHHIKIIFKRNTV